MVLFYNYGMIFLYESFFVNYNLSFGLVGASNYSALSAGAHIEYSSRSCAEDMTITNVIIKPPNRK